MVAGLLSDLGHDVSLKTFETVMSTPRIIEEHDALLISVMSQDMGALEKLVNLARRSLGYKGIVMVGGPGSFDYEKILREIKGIDYVVVGEAEIPLRKLFGDKQHVLLEKNPRELGEIPALAYIHEDKVVLTTQHLHTPREILSSLNPWVRIDESYPNHRIYRYYVEVLRGCSNFHRPLIRGYPGLECIRCMLCYSRDLSKRLNCPVGIPPGCGFCSVPYQFGSPRSRDPESTVREIEGLIEHGARRIVLSAPDFLDYMREKLVEPHPLTDPCKPGANKEAIEELLSMIHDIPDVTAGKIRVFVENIKACLVDEEVAEIFGRYLKGTTIHIGLETGDYEFNKLIGKPIGPKEVLRAIRLLKKHGLRPYVYLMYGLPFMTRRTYEKTIRIVKKLRSMGVEKITLYKFTPLPHTAFSRLKPETRRHRRLIAELKEIVDKHNMYMKKRLIGKRIEAYLLYSNGKYYGYPADHGPVIFVKNLDNPQYSGCKGIVEITDIAPRHVWGRFVKIIDC